VLVEPAAATFIAATIQRAVVSEPVIGAVDSFPGRSDSGPARDDGVMETLTRQSAGATERRLRVVRRSPRLSCYREQGGDRGDQSAERSTSRRMLRQRPGYDVKSAVIHSTHLPAQGGRSRASDRPG
jgi:hypothetical protein